MLYIRDIVPEPDPVDGLISRACMARYLLGLKTGDFSETYHFVSWTKVLPFDFWDAAQGEEVQGAFGPVNHALFIFQSHSENQPAPQSGDPRRTPKSAGSTGPCPNKTSATTN
jgi:hypothetical protein